MKKRILIVEDDASLARVLRDNLTCEGFEVLCVADGGQALSKAVVFDPDLVILDLMLPGRNGFDLCRALCEGRRRTSVIILTVRGQKADKLRGLKLGADDYVTKPFDLEEFLARVQAVLRRTRPGNRRLTLGSVTIDFRILQAWSRGRPLELTHREFDLLRYLAERQESVVGRDELLREVWRYPDVVDTRSVDHAISRLRRKLEPDAHHPKFIRTVHGDGYCLTPSGDDTSSQDSGS